VTTTKRCLIAGAALVLFAAMTTGCSEDTDLGDLFPDDDDRVEQPSDPNRLQNPKQNPDKPEDEEPEPPPKTAAPSTPRR
jgi:hypothetical protein